MIAISTLVLWSPKLFSLILPKMDVTGTLVADLVSHDKHHPLLLQGDDDDDDVMTTSSALDGLKPRHFAMAW